jgi:hypothetical protein
MTSLFLVGLLLAPAAFADVPGRGGGCNSYCTLDDAPPIGHEEVAELLAAWSLEEMEAPSLPLETLLFYGDYTLALLENQELSPERRWFLEKELSRDRVLVEMRLVDDSGAVRGELTPRPVPLSQKQHLGFGQTGSLGAFVTAGQVKRVGLGHLWSRW